MEIALGDEKYAAQAAADFNRLSDFLASREQLKLIREATPADIRDFCIWREDFGRTQLHRMGCEFRGTGQKKKQSCECPMTMTHGTLNSLLGRLGTMFNRIGMRGEYILIQRDGNVSRAIGNPCRGQEVKDMEAFIRKEQALAGIRVSQVPPFILEKLQRLMSYLTIFVVTEDLTPLEVLVIRSDMTFYAVDHILGRRGGDFRHIETTSLALLPGQRTAIFNLDWGKTLRGGGGETFAVERDDEDPIMDPIWQLECLKQAAIAVGVDMSTGYLFRDHTPQQASEDMMNVQRYTERLKKYLIQIGQFEGETLHSFRSEAALEKKFSGKTLEQILVGIGWSSEKMAEHYMAFEKVMLGQDTTNKSKAEIRQLYHSMNKLTGFSPVF
eukprot:Lithocolla_globosa_v1_NODE_5097_length_1306_cov_8.553157.p1 type:complete len:384 gc:universal NODE_5097_length_1306_cov_8.553157:151-1302(+)